MVSFGDVPVFWINKQWVGNVLKGYQDILFSSYSDVVALKHLETQHLYHVLKKMKPEFVSASSPTRAFTRKSNVPR